MKTRSLTWSEFCEWLQGKRVVWESPSHDSEKTVLSFSDGTVAVLTSAKSEGSPGYSEYTPGSDGHLVPPTVIVEEPTIRTP